MEFLGFVVLLLILSAIMGFLSLIVAYFLLRGNPDQEPVQEPEEKPYIENDEYDFGHNIKHNNSDY